jgi:hypothetical protein
MTKYTSKVNIIRMQSLLCRWFQTMIHDKKMGNTMADKLFEKFSTNEGI